MALAKTEAIILKSQKQGETTKILTCYTKAFGKIHIIAKGARTSKSRFWGNLEPINHVVIVFYHKENRDLQLLSQVDILRSFLHIRSELGRTSLAMMACEWINLSEMGEEANVKMFNLLYETLNGLDKATKGLKNVLRCFQLHLLELHGFKPELMNCTTCREQTVPDLVNFNLNEGTYQCNCCHSANGVPLTGASLSFLRWLDQVNPSTACDVTIKPEAGNEIDDLLLQFAKLHIESLKNLRVPKVITAISANLQN